MHQINMEEIRAHIDEHRRHLQAEVSHSYALQAKFLAQLGRGLSWCGGILERWGAVLQTPAMQLAEFPTEQGLLRE